MTALQTVFAAIELIIAIALIVIVTMQESEQGGMGAISGGADTFFGKSGGNPRTAMLRKATMGLGVLFVLVTIATVFVIG